MMVAERCGRYITGCPIGCEAGFEVTDLRLSEGRLLRCRECGQLVSQCSEAQFVETMREFSDPHGTWPPPRNASSHRRGVAKFLARCEAVLGRRREEIRLLDVGCSSGAFLHTAREMGVRGVGVEPSIEAANAARAAGLEVYQGFLEELPLAAESFDVITLFEVVEHLRAPLSVLRACHRLLRPGGVIFLKTGNTSSWTVRIQKGKWHYFDIRKHGGHVSFFTPHSVAVLAGRSGFEPLEIVTRSVELFGAGEHRSWAVRRSLKVLNELAQLPAKLSGNGQELFVFLGKK